MKNARLPKNHAAVRRVQAAYKRIDEARCDLENVLYDAYTEDQGAKLDMYYPDPADRAARQQEKSEKHSYASAARLIWPEHCWVTGDGPYATVSYCNSYIPPPEPGEATTTVILYATEQDARQALEAINRTGCGGGCTRNHELFALTKGTADGLLGAKCISHAGAAAGCGRAIVAAP